MSMRATGTFESTSWEEQPLRDVEGAPKLAHASMAAAYQGDIEGEGTTDYLITYFEDGMAHFVGTDYFNGQVNGRSGTFLMHSEGTHEGTSLRGVWRIVPGTGTGDLQGIKGGGSFSTEGSPTVTFSLDCDFE